MNSPFNPIQYVHQLEEAGVPNKQAEVHANTLVKVLDNYAQLQELKEEVSAAVAASELRMRAEIAEVEARLRAEIAGVEARLGAELAGVEARLGAEIARVEARLRTEFNARFDKLEAEIKRMRLSNAIVIALAIAILAQGYFR